MTAPTTAAPLTSAAAGLRRKLAAMIRLADHLHLPASDRGDPGRYKEWQHFCVTTDEVSLVVNLSLAGAERARTLDADQSAPGFVLDSRVTVLVHSSDGWEGTIEAIAARDFAHRTGQMEFALGDNRVEFRGGVYHLTLALQDQPIAARLALAPASMPLLLTKLPVSSGDLHWFVLPRLEADRLPLGRSPAVSLRRRARLPRSQLGSLGLGRRLRVAVGLRGFRRGPRFHRGLRPAHRSPPAVGAGDHAGGLARAATDQDLSRRSDPHDTDRTSAARPHREVPADHETALSGVDE